MLHKQKPDTCPVKNVLNTSITGNLEAEKEQGQPKPNTASLLRDRKCPRNLSSGLKMTILPNEKLMQKVQLLLAITQME